MPEDYSYATPVETQTPPTTGGEDYSFAKPVDSSEWVDRGQGFRTKPTVTHNGKPSYQREDNAVWYGPEQGNQGPGGWFDANGHRVSSAPRPIDIQAAQGQAPAPQPQPSATQQFIRGVGNTPVLGGGLMGGQIPGQSSTWSPTLAGTVKGVADIPLGLFQGVSHLADYAPGPGKDLPSQHNLGPMADKAVDYVDKLYSKYFDTNKSGEILGQVLPFVASAGLSAAGEAPAAANAVKTGLGALAKRVATTGLKTAAEGAAIVPAITPETGLNPNNPNDYAERKQAEAAGGALVGGVLGGAVEAAPEAIAAVRKTPAKIKNWIAGFKGELPPEVLSGEAPEAVINSVKQSEKLNPTQYYDNGEPIPKQDVPLQRIKQLASEGDPDAKAALQRLNSSIANKNDVPLSLGDVTQDPKVMAAEKALESQPGSKVAEFRAKQGEAINKKINDIPEAQFNPAGDIQHSFEGEAAQAADFDKENWASRVINKAEAARTNDQIVQASLEGKHWQNSQQAGRLFNQVDAEIQAGLEANPALPKAPDMTTPQALFEDLHTTKGGVKPDPAVTSALDLIDPSKIDSYQNAKEAVSILEGKAQELAISNNNKGAKAVKSLAKSIDEQADTFAKSVLPVDSEGVTSADKASKYYADYVAPYTDPNTGISKIVRGEYADKATKRLYAVDSPQEFETLYNSLDPKGQAALKSEMLQRANEAATSGGTKPFDLQAWKNYITKHEEQIGTAFRGQVGVPSEPEQLAQLISSTPRAGVGGNTPVQNVFNLNMKNVGAGLLGYGAHDPLTGLAGMAAETGAEVGYNALRGSMLTRPDLSRYTGKQIAATPLFQDFIKTGAAPTITTQAAFNRLAPGSVYIDSQGNRAVKP